MLMWLGVGVTLAVLVALFVLSEARRGRAALAHAATHEGAGQFAAACYHYAVATRAAGRAARAEAKVRDLWQQHGPFEFEELGREVRGSFCKYESCGQGYDELVLKDIQRIVTGAPAPGGT